MTREGSARRAEVRFRRPPRGLAGAVEEHILGAARVPLGSPLLRGRTDDRCRFHLIGIRLRTRCRGWAR
jgi:hypothetical protein